MAERKTLAERMSFLLEQLPHHATVPEIVVFAARKFTVYMEIIHDVKYHHPWVTGTDKDALDLLYAFMQVTQQAFARRLDMAELHWQYDRFRNQLWESANTYHVAIQALQRGNDWINQLPDNSPPPSRRRSARLRAPGPASQPAPKR